MTYDDMYQLTDVNYPSGSDFAYEYDANELTQYTDGAVTMMFTYASDGCLKTKSDGVDSWTYDWDYERRLAAFRENSALLVEYGYNPTGTRRYSSDSTLGLTNYFHSGGHVLGDYSSSWCQGTSYIVIPDGSEIITMVDRSSDPNVSHYLTHDRLGSTREILDPSEVIETRYGYDAWGVVSETLMSGSVTTSYQFGARQNDPTSGLYHCFIGDYDKGIRRFISREPLYHDAGEPFRAYAYPHNNPSMFFDSRGGELGDIIDKVVDWIESKLDFEPRRSCKEEQEHCKRQCDHYNDSWKALKSIYGTDCKLDKLRQCHECCDCKYDVCNAYNIAGTAMGAVGLTVSAPRSKNSCVELCCSQLGYGGWNVFSRADCESPCSWNLNGCWCAKTGETHEFGISVCTYVCKSWGYDSIYNYMNKTLASNGRLDCPDWIDCRTTSASLESPLHFDLDPLFKTERVIPRRHLP